MSTRVTLFIGTRRGLFLAHSDESRRKWSISAPLLPGREIYHAIADPRREDTVWAASAHSVWGAHIHRSDDGGTTFRTLDSAPHFNDERGLEAIWFIAPGPESRPASLYAGIEPAGLFESDDAGATWKSIDSLNNHESRVYWQPAGGSLSLHSILFDPFDPQRIYCAVSAGGAYRSTDGGNEWKPINDGVRADFLLNPHPASGQCVHKMILHPAARGRLYQQNHCGVYRSDDGGTRWMDIGGDLPSSFGYVLATNVHDADTLYIIPEESSHMRTTLEGRIRVYRTRDGGSTWQPLTNGLPQQNAWVSVLREAMTNDSLLPVGVYFGTSSGHVFASPDGGDTWHLVAEYLPRILSVTARVQARQ
jgi:photosystem II stability/assembly factor-like uncharacterized protein